MQLACHPGMFRTVLLLVCVSQLCTYLGLLLLAVLFSTQTATFCRQARRDKFTSTGLAGRKTAPCVCAKGHVA